ncbi:LPP20 family lipoprotein [Candidatus Latescibacterota bacterium]
MSVNKLFFRLFVFFLAASLLFIACAGSMPRWYLNPPKSDDKIFGVGVSEKTASIQLGRDVAVANARSDLAAKIQVNVQSMLRTFLQQSGTMEESRAMQFSESVGKQVVNVTLTGSDVTRTEIRKGRYFAQVEISMESINNAIHTAARNAAADYSELKAKSALEDLDKAIDKLNLNQ